MTTSLRRRPLHSTLVFFAFTTPLGIAAHLISELAGLGWHDDADVAFSARHAYLAALALITVGGLLFSLRKVPRAERRANVATLVDGLPFGGRGVAFTLLTFVAQFAFFAVTQIGEGCPLCGGDVLVGVVAAAIAALIGACAIALGKRRVLELILGLGYTSDLGHSADLGSFDAARSRRTPQSPSRRRTPFAFRYRPPPNLQFA